MRTTNIIISRAILLVLLGATVDAFWRMPCRARSGLARIDPLVSNGTISEHAHAIHGSNGFSETAGYDALMAGTCTSCEVAQDKSAYWTPAIYFKSASGQFTLVNQIGGMLAYYLLYPNTGNTTLSAFPRDFQMIAGDTNQRNFNYPVPDIPKSNWNTAPYNTQAFLQQAALGFNCLNYAKTPEGSLYRHFLPDKAYLDANCADGIRFELMFPSCWNGKDANSSDHKSHVAYPSQVMTGDCPSDFPERLPSLFYETIWDTHAFAGQDGTFVIANGDSTGYGYHGDFMMGWSPKFLQSAVDKCTNLSGQITDCPLFTIQDDSVFGNCNIALPAAITKENVIRPGAALPGNPAMGGSAAPGKSAATTVAAAAPTLGYSAGVSLASTDTYVPGGIFAVSTGGTFSSYAEPTTSSTFVAPTKAEIAAIAPSVTAAPEIAAASVANGQSFFSKEVTTSGRAVIEVLWVETEVTVTAEETMTVYATQGAYKRHLHRHRNAGRR